MTDILDLKGFYQHKELNTRDISYLLSWKSSVVKRKHFVYKLNGNKKEYFEFDILNNQPKEYKDDDYYRHRLIVDLPESKDEMPFIVFEFYEHIMRKEKIEIKEIKFNLNMNLKYTIKPEKDELWEFKLASEAKQFIKSKILEFITERKFDNKRTLYNEFNRNVSKRINKPKGKILQWTTRN